MLIKSSNCVKYVFKLKFKKKLKFSSLVVLATFQVLESLKWLMATMLDSAGEYTEIMLILKAILDVIASTCHCYRIPHYVGDHKPSLLSRTSFPFSTKRLGPRVFPLTYLDIHIPIFLSYNVLQYVVSIPTYFLKWHWNNFIHLFCGVLGGRECASQEEKL